MKKISLSRQDWFALVFILLVAFSLRLYKFNSPIADWHSFRQVDTAAVARNFEKDGFDLLHPRYDDLSNVATGQYNPEGLRFVEFPLYNASFAALHRFLPLMSLEQYGRLVTILFSLSTIIVIYYLLRMEVSALAAFYGALIYAVMPFFVFYSRVVLPDPTAISLAFLSIFFLYVWATKKTHSVGQFVYYMLALLSVIGAILVKPTTAFYLLPLAYVFFRKHTFGVFKRPEAYLFFILALAPFALWRYWISLFPVGGPGFEWLITSVNTFEGQKVIFMRPAFFRWIFYERILLLIMGGWAGLFVFLGALRRLSRPWLIYSIGISGILYTLTFQGGNVQHDYYQIMILPVLAIFGGMGIGLLYDIDKKLLPKFMLTIAVWAVLAFSAIMSFEQVKGMYNVSESLMNTARIIDTVTPKDALVITDTTGDTTLLYNAHRRGMPVYADSLPKLKERGMQYFVTSSDDAVAKIGQENPEYTIIFTNDDVTVFKL
jgi:Dolichyl-phosphate-mannose-protein mannosyltransferase